MSTIAPPPTPTLGTILRDRRRALGLRQQDVAREAGCSKATLQQLESLGYVFAPRPALLHGLARALALPPEELARAVYGGA